LRYIKTIVLERGVPEEDRCLRDLEKALRELGYDKEI
jgi:hypothetical protein